MYAAWYLLVLLMVSISCECLLLVVGGRDLVVVPGAGLRGSLVRLQCVGGVVQLVGHGA